MNVKKVSDAFFNSFNSNHVILYIGQNTSDEELKEYISKCPWSGIITSRRDPELASIFINEDRAPREFNARVEIPVKPLSRQKLPILRLFGVRGEQKEDDLAWLRTDMDGDDAAYNMNRALDMLHLLPSLLDHVNSLVVIGANSDIDWKLFGKELTYLLYKETSAGTVSFWDMPASVETKYRAAFSALKKAAEMKNFGFYEESLVEVIRLKAEEFAQTVSEAPFLAESENDIYYQGRYPISISQGDMLMFKNVGILLTERTVNKIRPLGRVMSRRWFINFLESSASLGPQWYGYLPQSDFHVKRSFEEALVQLVKKMLEGRSVTGAPMQNRPIILNGAPGSSKSITLAALAYTIYTEKVNPVIFISKDSFLGANIGTGVDELDEAMQLLERKSEADTRILVIWDSSAYKTGVERVHALLKKLRNRGRRFVLVCSSYNMYRDNEIESGYCYDEKNKEFKECSGDAIQIFDKSGCYFVKAIREMNSKETLLFWNRVKEYSGINDSTIRQFKKKIAAENRNEIFDYYYLLISVLRENLELGLKSEQSKVYSYVEKELKRAVGEIRSGAKKDKQMSPMYQAFLAAGMNLENYVEQEDTSELQNDEQEEVFDKKLDDLNLCVALFSRFKLSVPYGLAYTILVGEDGAEQYSDSNRDLYRIVTSEIPWLYYGEDEHGDFSFRFRNPLEADIFLRNHDFTGEQQIDLLCHIIDIYGMDYRRSKCKDEAFTDNLQALLRMIGPNSGYLPFRTTQEFEHNSILEKLDCLIYKLRDLLEEYGVSDEDAGFASIIVTFTREYYGAIWNKVYSSSVNSEQDLWEHNSAHFSVEDYEYRIEQLISAITMAESCIDAIENRTQTRDLSKSEWQHLMNQRYSLAVEIAQCNMRLEDLTEEYGRCCEYFGVSVKKDLIKRKLRYQELYRQLMPVISNNPTNGYAYNTLFKAFRRMYEKDSLPDAKKLQYLSEIMQVIETCDTLDAEITNRGSFGNNELTSHINHIKDFSSGFQITLDSIQRHRRGLPAADGKEQVCFDLYDEMLEANNAAAITFICQKELQLPKGTRKLNAEQVERCRKVYSFMKEDDNFECINANAYALAMLIRVSWMMYNKTVLSSSPECQLTSLKATEWVEMYRLTRQYNELAGENKQPLIILLYALSALQVSGLAEYGYQEATDILGLLSEEMFYQSRMWTPFMICQGNGETVKFTGTVLSTKDNRGFIRVNGMPLRLKKDVGVRFHQLNLGRKSKMPEERTALKDLEVGIGYTGFSVYNETGRKEREERS